MSISINFFPLETENFDFTIYCLPYIEGEQSEFIDDKPSLRSLDVDGNDVFDKHWIFFEEVPDSNMQVCQSSDNPYLTIDALWLALIESCNKGIDESKLCIKEKYRRYVEIITEEYNEGNRVVQLEPYYLKSREQFGFLVNQKFHPKVEYRRTIQVLKLRLILDKRGRVNQDYYINRHEQLVDFVKKFHDQIFPLSLPGNSVVQVSKHLIQLNAHSLKMRNYVVGSGDESSSQFMGIQKYGPVKGIPNDSRLYFIYGRQDHMPLRKISFLHYVGIHFLRFKECKKCLILKYLETMLAAL